jgi:hypothetical protein
VAIKGKGRTRGRRMVAAPPRPQLVVRKPPLWLRRSTWVGVAVVAVVGIGVAAALSIASSRADDRRNQALAALRRFTTQVHQALPEDRQAQAPDLVSVFPALGDDAAAMRSGDLGPGASREIASIVEGQARAAADSIDALVVSDIVPEGFRDLRTLLQDGQYLLVQSFRTFESAGGLMRVAPGLDGEQREAVLQQSQRMVSRGSSLFVRGYQKILDAFTANGVSLDQIPAPPAPVTEPEPSPVESPEPTPSP